MARSISQGARHPARRTRAVWYCLLACAGLGAGGAPLSAQEVHYIPRRAFYIPFKMDPGDHTTQEVRLNLSSDDGRSYQPVATARRAEERFLFQATADGWYSFAVQTRDAAGRLTPADLRGVPPSYKVCVDTRPPLISLKAVTANDGSPAAIQWEVQDDNFDDVRGDYRPAGATVWTYPLALPHTDRGVYGWRPAVGGPLEVRVQARDKANNVAEQVIALTPGPGRPGAPADAPDPGGVQHVKSTTFILKYSIDRDSVGPSDVEGVDIWVWRQNRAPCWQKLPQRGTPQGPCNVTVPEPGRWGFKLIARSGVGLAEPEPQPNELPKIWVEVDQQKPKVVVNRVHVTPGPDGGKVSVEWTASDAYLAPRPITIFYSTSGKDDWREVPEARNLPNSGVCTFAPPEKLWQFYVKVAAVDEAGNVGEEVWRQIVKVDLKVPRISEVKVSASDAPPPPPDNRGSPPGGGGLSPSGNLYSPGAGPHKAPPGVDPP